MKGYVIVKSTAYRIIRLEYANGKVRFMLQRKSLLGFWRTYSQSDDGYCYSDTWSLFFSLGYKFDDYQSAEKKMYELDDSSKGRRIVSKTVASSIMIPK